jgi:hypothetical protein
MSHNTNAYADNVVDVHAQTERLQLDGYSWWRVTPIDQFPHRYSKLTFNPLMYGFSISMWAIAMWMALDLLFQIHVTFRRFGGLYYWTVLCTTIGVGLHATMLTVKGFATLSFPEEIGTTVLIKAGDVLTQTGFSLVLYSRLNLVMRIQHQRYLKWILGFILIGSFCVHTPVIVFTFGVNTNPVFWFKHAARGEKILGVYFLLQEFVLQTIYTYTTARMLQDRSLAMSGSHLKHQSAKTRRNLLLFMVLAQFVTLGTDITLVSFTYLELLIKNFLHPFFYGFKLKVEFMALNQLQSLVQPNVRMFTFTGDQNPPNQPHRHAAKAGDLEQAGNQFLADEKDPLCCAHCPLSPAPSDLESPFSKEDSAKSDSSPGPSSPPANVQVSFTGTSTNQSFTEMERKYLGKYTK